MLTLDLDSIETKFKCNFLRIALGSCVVLTYIFSRSEVSEKRLSTFKNLFFLANPDIRIQNNPNVFTLIYNLLFNF